MQLFQSLLEEEGTYHVVGTSFSTEEQYIKKANLKKKPFHRTLI